MAGDSSMVLGALASLAAFVLLMLAPSPEALVPGIVELVSAVLLGLAMVADEVAPQKSWGRWLSGVAQLAMLLVVGVAFALTRGPWIFGTVPIALAALGILSALFAPVGRRRPWWVRAYVFTCVLAAALLVVCFALLTAMIPFGTAG